jgi:hypothetical protein
MASWRKKELNKLPIPFLVYYVIGCILTDEVNNGGFAQYLSNSSVHGGDNVRKRIKRTKNTLICGLVVFNLFVCYNLLK